MYLNYNDTYCKMVTPDNSQICLRLSNLALNKCMENYFYSLSRIASMETGII